MTEEIVLVAVGIIVGAIIGTIIGLVIVGVPVSTNIIEKPDDIVGSLVNMGKQTTIWVFTLIFAVIGGIVCYLLTRSNTGVNR